MAKLTKEEIKERNKIAVAKYRASKKGQATKEAYESSAKFRESWEASTKKYRDANKVEIASKSLAYYKANRASRLVYMKEYTEKYIKPLRGKVGTGNYNITLAERHKEEWLKELLTVYKLKILDTDGTVFYKVGLTKCLKNRLQHIPYEVEVVSSFEIDKYEAVYFEHNYLQSVDSYKPLVKFGGHTECFV